MLSLHSTGRSVTHGVIAEIWVQKSERVLISEGKSILFLARVLRPRPCTISVRTYVRTGL